MFGSAKTKIALLLVLVALTLGCVQNPSENSTKEINPEMLGIKIYADKEVYIREPVTIIVENVGNMTIKIKPKIPWEICSGEGCLKIEQSSVAFGIKKNGFESWEWIVIEPGGVVLWTYPSLKPGEYSVRFSENAVVVADGKSYSVKAACKFKVSDEEPGLEIGRLRLLERQSKFGSINLSDSEIFAEGAVTEDGTGVSLVFSIEPPLNLNESMNLHVRSDLGSVRVALYSTSSSWYTIEINNFVNKTQRAVDVMERLFKEPINVSITISKESIAVENTDTGEKMTLRPSEDWLRETYGDSLEIHRVPGWPPTYTIYGDAMTVSVEFGEMAESAKYLMVETGFSPDIPKKPKLWMYVPDFKSSPAKL